VVDGKDLYALVDVSPPISSTGNALDVQRVVRVPSGCGVPVAVSESPGLTVGGLAVAQGQVYWGTGDGIMSAPVAGGAPSTVVAAPLAYGVRILVHGNQLYWSDGQGDVSTVALAGGSPRLVASGLTGDFAVDDSNLYATILGEPGDSGADAQDDGGAASGTGSVVAVPLAGGPVTTLASQQHRPGDPVVSGGTIYWINGSTSGVDTYFADGTIRTMSAPGATPSTLASGETGPSELTLIGTTLYWINGENSMFAATIRKLPAGGSPTDVVRTSPPGIYGAQGFTVDATRVYWAISSTVTESDIFSAPN
jgi:hypothetical protein